VTASRAHCRPPSPATLRSTAWWRVDVGRARRRMSGAAAGAQVRLAGCPAAARPRESRRAASPGHLAPCLCGGGAGLGRRSASGGRVAPWRSRRSLSLADSHDLRAVRAAATGGVLRSWSGVLSLRRTRGRRGAGVAAIVTSGVLRLGARRVLETVSIAVVAGSERSAARARRALPRLLGPVAGIGSRKPETPAHAPPPLRGPRTSPRRARDDGPRAGAADGHSGASPAGSRPAHLRRLEGRGPTARAARARAELSASGVPPRRPSPTSARCEVGDALGRPQRSAPPARWG